MERDGLQARVADLESERIQRKSEFKECGSGARNARGAHRRASLAPLPPRKLDDFRFKLRMPSRAAAIRELLKRGLSAEGFESAAFGSKSEEFGVIGRTPDGRGN